MQTVLHEMAHRQPRGHDMTTTATPNRMSGMMTTPMMPSMMPGMNTMTMMAPAAPVC
jgi:hypothetical protein